MLVQKRLDCESIIKIPASIYKVIEYISHLFYRMSNKMSYVDVNSVHEFLHNIELMIIFIAEEGDMQWITTSISKFLRPPSNEL